ncbi:MAG: phosphopentomutase [Planctomycetota bacterium]
MREDSEELAQLVAPLRFRRAIVVVLDSLGVGELPDAGTFGDAGAHTLDHICEAAGQPVTPRLMSLGLGNIQGVERFPAAVVPEGAFGRMAEVSAGKDTTTGHWEMMGLRIERGFPTFPGGFDPELLAEIARAAGIPGWLGNEVASGTEIIERLGPEHVETGKPIVYTSADSVLQIAAHEEHFGIEELFDLCEAARELTVELGIARVIARPFVDAPDGSETRFVRTYNRQDFSLKPPKETVIEAMLDAGLPVVGVGKIEDIFDGYGVSRAVHTAGNADGMHALRECLRTLVGGMVFVNLVDFDMNFGHRRDPAGYRSALEEFDEKLVWVEERLRDDDLVILTADHGNDPTKAEHTDHTREFVPLVVYGKNVKGGVDLGTRATFADVAATIAQNFELPYECDGTSFLDEVWAG